MSKEVCCECGKPSQIVKLSCFQEEYHNWNPRTDDCEPFLLNGELLTDNEQVTDVEYYCKKCLGFDKPPFTVREVVPDNQFFITEGN